MEFKGNTYNLAVAEAISHFKVASAEMMEIKLLEKGAPGLLARMRPWRIDAEPKDSAVNKLKSASTAQNTGSASETDVEETPFSRIHNDNFSVEITENGVMLESEPNINVEELLMYIQRRGIQGADIKQAVSAVQRGERVVMLAPPQSGELPPADDIFTLVMSGDAMSANMIIYPGDHNGKRLALGDVKESLMSRLEYSGNIDTKALITSLNKRVLRQPFVVARGKPAVDGEHGSIEYHFEQSHSKRPKIIDNDRVDYRTLDIFQKVSKGDLLVTRTPPTQGEDGVTLQGKVLKAKPGKDAKMPRGRGILVDEENLHMYAAQDGMVNLIDNQVVVSSVYVVENDVDMSVGNIDFNGDVEVRGNVISGMTVRAEGSIEVQGVVEAAKLMAKGNIVLRQGMRGNDRGVVYAGGDIVARYFERAHIQAGGAITADAIYHSEISAVEGITLVGKHQSMIGGNARSATVVTARIIGSVSNTATVVEVGILPEQRERYVFLETEIRRLEAERDKLNMLVISFQNPAKETPQNKIELRNKVMSGYEQTVAQLEEYTQERDVLQEAMAAITGGKVHVLGTVYPGARVVIGSAVYVADTQIDFATFHVSGGEVRFSPCEI